jgi:hypothetical protein
LVQRLARAWATTGEVQLAEVGTTATTTSNGDGDLRIKTRLQIVAVKSDIA